MRSSQIFGVAAVAMSLGICSLGVGGALAATPTLNFQARNNLDLRSLAPAQAGVPALSLMANKDPTSPRGFAALAAAGSDQKLATRAAGLRTLALAMLFVPREGAAKPGQSARDAMGQHMPKESKGLAELRAAAGLPKATPEPVRRIALAAAHPRSDAGVKLLSSLAAR